MLQLDISLSGNDPSPQLGGAGNSTFMCIETSKISLLAVDGEAYLPPFFCRYPIDVFGELPISAIKGVIDEPKVAPTIVQPIVVDVVNLHAARSGEKHSVHLSDPGNAVCHQVGDGVLPGFDAGLLNGPTVLGQEANVGNVNLGFIYTAVHSSHFDDSNIALNVNFTGSVCHGDKHTPKADALQAKRI